MGPSAGAHRPSERGLHAPRTMERTVCVCGRGTPLGFSKKIHPATLDTSKKAVPRPRARCTAVLVRARTFTRKLDNFRKLSRSPNRPAPRAPPRLRSSLTLRGEKTRLRPPWTHRKRGCARPGPRCRNGARACAREFGRAWPHNPNPDPNQAPLATSDHKGEVCPGPGPAAPRRERRSCVRTLRVDNLRACQVCASTNVATVAADHACLGTGATLQIFTGVARPLIVPGAKPKAKPNVPGPRCAHPRRRGASSARALTIGCGVRSRSSRSAIAERRSTLTFFVNPGTLGDQIGDLFDHQGEVRTVLGAAAPRCEQCSCVDN